MLWLAATFCLSSCDSMLHDDDTTECPEGLVIQLVPKYAARSSFESELTDVHIFIYNDADNSLAKEITVSNEQLVQSGFQVQALVPVGNYHMIVWNGLSDTGNYTEKDNAVTLNTDVDNSTDQVFMPLWHGEASDAKVEALNMTHVEVPMVKDTNNFVVYLCTTDGTTLDPADFDMFITCANGSLDKHNNVLDGPNITYNDYACEEELIEGSIDAEIANPDSLGYLHTVRSNINTLRLTTDKRSWLTVYNKRAQANVITFSLNDYILKAFRSANINSTVSNQEYLDTEDLFNITLFLTPRADTSEENEGIYFISYLKIGPWILRVNNAELGKI
jgi:hypothetical protein